jgi:peptidyl-tRNA hydrolase, PTH1 family
MKLIAGLGNPGPRYDGTRHNVGFDVLNAFADRHFFPSAKMRFEGLITDHQVGGEKVLLLAPQTYMNNSGRSVRQCLDFYRIEPSDVLVLLDDMNLDLGRLRLRGQGSAGGQKGLADIIQQLGTDSVSRLRIGVGQPPGRMSGADFVLQRFMDKEREIIDLSVQEAVAGLECWVRSGLEAAMNVINPSKSEPSTKRRRLASDEKQQE